MYPAPKSFSAVSMSLEGGVRPGESGRRGGAGRRRGGEPPLGLGSLAPDLSLGFFCGLAGLAFDLDLDLGFGLFERDLLGLEVLAGLLNSAALMLSELSSLEAEGDPPFPDLPP